MKNNLRTDRLLALLRVAARGRIRVTLGPTGANITAENALAIIAAVILVALLVL